MRLVEYPRIVVVGLGGLWRTLRDVAFFLSYYSPATKLVLVDGGTFKPRHRDHERFDELGNKARVTGEWLAREFPELACEVVRAFLGEERVEGVVRAADVIRPGDIVFLQVDNNRSKRLVDLLASTLPDITVISGGTAGDLLRVQIYVRRGGVDITPPFSSYCHDIASPRDELPNPPCPGLHQAEEPRTSDVHHPFTLLSTSTFVVNGFYQVMRLDDGELDRFVYDTWYDIRRAKLRVETVVVQQRAQAEMRLSSGIAASSWNHGLECALGGGRSYGRGRVERNSSTNRSER